MDVAISRLSDETIRAGKSGLLLVTDNDDAFAVRILAARSAQRSLDLMYYLWRDDHTGRVLMREVVKAAERGVKVRMLLDDINPRASDAAYLAMNSHPNIELRLFNASGMRNGNLLRGLEWVARVFALTRRMHNKAWIADDDVAIVGGRNIGDAYFDAAETNFRDLDLLMLGPAVSQARAIFESFWTCSAVKPIHLLNPAPGGSRAEHMERLDASTDAKLMDCLGRHKSMAEYIAAAGDIFWTEKARVISDPPEKVRGRRRRNWLLMEILPVIRAARHRVEIVSPYFIPGRKGSKMFRRLVKAGADVTVLTNSLAATDVAAVHGAYSNYRKRLLRHGVHLFELQPFSRQDKHISVFGSKGASLHTKAFTVDDRIGFVGSFNFDPRSVSLNSEMGVLVEDRALVAALSRRFEAEKSPDASYELTLKHNRLHWHGVFQGQVRDFTHEPEASLFRRFVAKVVRFLPIESQL